MNILKAYRTTLILLGAIVLGAIVGLVFGKNAEVLQPIGQLFLNALFMVITPLVFFCIAAAIANISGTRRFGNVAAGIVIVFVVTSVVAGIIGLIGFLAVPPLAHSDVAAVKALVSSAASTTTQGSVADQIVGTFTVSDFQNLLSKQYMLPLIIFSAFLGWVATRLGEKSEAVLHFLETGRELMLKMIGYIMYAAPIGIGCYFAYTIGELGSEILTGYLTGFIVYTIIGLVYFFGVFTVYAFVAGGGAGVAAFWKNIIPSAAMSLSTCSSAACIPINLETTQKMGVVKQVSETVVPLGANIHKDGSVIGGVFKIAFIFALFGRGFTPWTIVAALGVALLVGTTMVAIPTGGMVAELIVLSIFGFPAQYLPVLAVISTIIDPMATMLNVSSNCVSAMLVNKFVGRKKTPISAEPALVG